MRKIMGKDWKKYRLLCAGVGAATVLLSTAMVGLSIVLQYAIDFMLAGRTADAVKLTVVFLLIFAALYVVRSAGLVTLNQNVMSGIRAKLVGKILSMDYLEFEQHTESEYLSIITNDIQKVEDEYLDKLCLILDKSVQLVLAIAVMTYYSWVFTVVMFAMTAVMFLVPSYFTKKLQKATEAFSKSQEELTAGVREVSGGFRVIKSFRQETNRMEKFARVNQGRKAAGRTLGILQKENQTVSNVLGLSMQMVICVLAAWFIFHGKMTYGSLLGVIQVSGNITVPLFELFSAIPAVKAFKPIWEKIGAYTEGEETKPYTVCRQEDGWNTISLEQVNFQYPGSKTAVLQDVSLTIERGRKMKNGFRKCWKRRGLTMSPQKKVWTPRWGRTGKCFPAGSASGLRLRAHCMPGVPFWCSMKGLAR